MGNQSSVEEHDEFKNITKKYTFEKKYTDSRFGEIKLLREKSTKIQVFQKDISCNTQLEYELISKEIKERSTYSHPNLLKVLGFVSKKEDMFCADFFKISLFYESFEEDLEQAIFKRQKTNDYFQEVELWYIFDSIVSVLAFLQDNKLYHGDIRPFNVFINAAQEYKIHDPALFRANFQPGYFGLLETLEDRSHYPSPQLFKVLKGENVSEKFNKTKNDVYGLGLTLLEAAHLKKCEGIYNWDNFEVNEDRIEQLLGELKDKYSETFIQTLRFTLNPDENERPDFLSLDRELAPYRVDIRARISHQQPPTQIVAERLSVPVEDELEKRVRAALRKSEETISRSSPSKYQNKHLDPYIHSYINNEPIPQDKPLLQTISAYLSAENKYTMTLTQYPADGERATEMRRSQFAQEERKDIPVDQTTSTYGYQPNVPVQESGNILGGLAENVYQGAQYQPYTAEKDLAKSGVEAQINPYSTDTYNYGNNPQPSSTGYEYQPYGGTTSTTNQGAGAGTTSVDTAELMRQVQETLKKSQSLVQPQ